MIEFVLACVVSAIIGWIARGSVNAVVLAKEYQRGVGDGAWSVAKECADTEPALIVVKGGKKG